MRRASNVLLVVTFAAILLAPTVASLAGRSPMAALDENRALAKRPTASLWSRDGFRRASAIAQEWELYFNDHFGLRKFLIGTFRLATFHILRVSPDPAVVVGKSDSKTKWLFFNAPAKRDGVGFDSLLGKKPYSAAAIAAIDANLKRAAALALTNGVRLVIAVCPDKQSVYPEYLPARLQPKPGATSRLDQFWALTAGLEGVTLVDLRAPLKSAKGALDLYYPKDTHWNLRGAVIGYRAIAKALQAQDPVFEPMQVDSLTWVPGDPAVGDLARMLGLPTIRGDEQPLVILPALDVLGGKRQGKLLVLGDSFFEGLRPFFERQFTATKKMTGARRAGTPWLTQALLDAEKPDVVMVESVERYWTMD
jgi:hypothetical protein